MRGARTRRRDRTRTTTWFGLLVALLATLAVAACSGEGESAPSAGTPAGTENPSATGAPITRTATATATPEPMMVPPGTLDSYRYAIALSVASGAIEDAADGDGGSSLDLSGAEFTITIDGAVVNPDRERSETHASLGFIELSLERIEIGDRAWTREAGGEWKAATPGAASPAIGGDLEVSPARIFAADGSAFMTLNDELRTLDFTADEVHGLATRRYELDPERFRSVFGGESGLLPGDSQPLDARGTLWVAEELRVPVRIRLTSTGPDGSPAFEMDLTLTDLNEPITIEPPL